MMILYNTNHVTQTVLLAWTEYGLQIFQEQCSRKILSFGDRPKRRGKERREERKGME
jgi:hypothetical protein